MTSLSRRALLLSGGALAFSCKDQMQNAGMAPWRMWGSEQILTIGPTTGAGITSVPKQLASIAYGRPETWSFLFVAQPVEMTAGWANNDIDLFFDVNLGTGRAVTFLGQTNFLRYSWILPAEQGLKWNSQIPQPIRFTGDTIQTFADHLVAETIVCNARITEDGSAPVGQTANIRVAAYFAPRTHVRPEWFEERFPGGENQGT